MMPADFSRVPDAGEPTATGVIRPLPALVQRATAILSAIMGNIRTRDSTTRHRARDSLNIYPVCPICGGTIHRVDILGNGGKVFANCFRYLVGSGVFNA